MGKKSWWDEGIISSTSLSNHWLFLYPMNDGTELILFLLPSSRDPEKPKFTDFLVGFFVFFRVFFFRYYLRRSRAGVGTGIFGTHPPVATWFEMGKAVCFWSWGDISIVEVEEIIIIIHVVGRSLDLPPNQDAIVANKASGWKCNVIVVVTGRFQVILYLILLKYCNVLLKTSTDFC